MNIILIGFMGSGKSSTARFISKQYKLRFIDTDKIIEKKMKITIGEVFDKYGEKFFRRVERETISRNLLFCSNCVIATGGGMPCYSNNIKLLKKIGWVFHLDISFNDIIKRVKNKTNRPLLNDIENAKKLYIERIKCYSEADFHINASTDTNEVAKVIMSQINP